MPPKPKTQSPISRSAKPSARGQARKREKREIPIEERLKRLFTSLYAQVDGGHFRNAIRTCDKILVLQPGDADALQTKLFLLLQTEEYESALALVISGDDGPDKYSFEKAYALYRLQKEEEARDLLDYPKGNGDEVDRGVLHLEAQLNYRTGAYQGAFDIYNQLLDSADPDTEEHSDILVNVQATQKHLEFMTNGYLRSLDQLPSSLADSLETSPPPNQPGNIAILSSSDVPTGSVAAPPTKKVRLRRVPKGVTPGITPAPDPERWLKKSERTNVVHTGKKKKGGAGGATQGSTTDGSSAGVTTSNQSRATGGKGKKKK